MLLRSASSPLLNCVRAPAAAAAAVEHLAVVSPLLSPAAAPRQGAVLCRAMSEGDLVAPLVPRKDHEGHGIRAPRLSASTSSSASISLEEEDSEGEEEEEETVVAVGADVPLPLRQLLTSTGLDASASASAARDALAALVEQGGGGGKACGGSGGQGGVGDGGGSGGDNRAATDAHYRRMIEADPGNSLLLVNYARFLKVEGDAAKAQEYCERAILASPGDAEALSLYAGLVWETSRDAARADDYYNRAVQAAPDDCYVLGSYAGFLWDAEEDDEESDNSEPSPPPSLFQGAAQHPSIIAAS